MNLNSILDKGISLAVRTAARFYPANKAVRSYIAGLAPVMRKNAAVRKRFEREGTHVPPYMIASIASRCNLRCTGCYARAGGACADEENDQGHEMNAGQWERIFNEAEQLGVFVYFTRRREPLLRAM
jgi:hypothetical protein